MDHSWHIENVTIRLVQGDLFTVGAQAIVNSEQTDFVLARSADTVSGQIWLREGSVQTQLDQQTQRRSRPNGTVLRTTGGGISQSIYHLGFHHPSKSGDEDEQTDYIRIIRVGVREIMERADRDGLGSVAYPLVGCGLFGLDPGLLAYEFLSEVMKFARARKVDREFEVWLVVREEEHLHRILQAAVQAALDSSASDTGNTIETGVEYLDTFAAENLRTTHPQWRCWILTRYVELLVGFIFAHMAKATDPPIALGDLVDRDSPIPFGSVRTKAQQIAQTIRRDSGWASFFGQIVVADKEINKVLETINQDRNNIAHGRKFRSADEIDNDIRTFIDEQHWQEKTSELGRPPVSDLERWVIKHDEEGGLSRIGVLEKWREDRDRYLDPVTGETFNVPISLAGGGGT